MDGLAGLSHLMVRGQPAGVDGGAAAADNAAQLRRQFFRQLDAAFHVLADAASHGDDIVRADEVHQLFRGLDHFHDFRLEIVLAQGERGLHDFHAVRFRLVKGFLLHHARTDRRHAGTEAGADDGGHEVAAERRTGHLEIAGNVVLLAHDNRRRQFLNFLRRQCGGPFQEIPVLGHIHVQMCAVRAQARMETRRAAGAKIAANVRRADQERLRLEVLDDVADYFRVGVRVVDRQQGMFADIDLVRAIAAQLFGNAFHAFAAQQQPAQVHAQFVRQVPALGNQLKIGGHELALALFAEYPYVLERANIRTVEFRHTRPSPFVK